MIKKKPYKQFSKRDLLTQETAVLGISVKDWHQAFTANFEENLKTGNELMGKLMPSIQEK